jgi:chemotaxis receptor (MCP) glutamine deamidase CheD
VIVQSDDYAVVEADSWLCASPRLAFALCIYDAVQETGALLHLRIIPSASSRNPELTDNTLSANLELLERCQAELRAVNPRAKNLQAKLVAQVDDNAPARERCSQLQSFLAAYLVESRIKLISVAVHMEPDVSVRFRPSLAQVVIATSPPARTDSESE